MSTARAVYHTVVIVLCLQIEVCRWQSGPYMFSKPVPSQCIQATCLLCMQCLTFHARGCMVSFACCLKLQMETRHHSPLYLQLLTCVWMVLYPFSACKQNLLWFPAHFFGLFASRSCYAFLQARTSCIPCMAAQHIARVTDHEPVCELSCAMLRVSCSHDSGELLASTV